MLSTLLLIPFPIHYVLVEVRPKFRFILIYELLKWTYSESSGVGQYVERVHRTSHWTGSVNVHEECGLCYRVGKQHQPSLAASCQKAQLLLLLLQLDRTVHLRGQTDRSRRYDVFICCYLHHRRHHMCISSMPITNIDIGALQQS